MLRQRSFAAYVISCHLTYHSLVEQYLKMVLIILTKIFLIREKIRSSRFKLKLNHQLWCALRIIFLTCYLILQSILTITTRFLKLKY